MIDMMDALFEYIKENQIKCKYCFSLNNYKDKQCVNCGAILEVR